MKLRFKVPGGDNHRGGHSGSSERPPPSSLMDAGVLGRMGRVCENWFAVCDQDIPRSASRSNNDALLLGAIGIKRVPGSAHDKSKPSTEMLVLQLPEFDNVSHTQMFFCFVAQRLQVVVVVIVVIVVIVMTVVVVAVLSHTRW